MQGMAKDLMLVGSIPLDTVSDVFEKFGKPLGDHLSTIPMASRGHASIG
jgi:hypothetical protein